MIAQMQKIIRQSSHHVYYRFDIAAYPTTYQISYHDTSIHGNDVKIYEQPQI
jgi:hypothetical protein